MKNILILPLLFLILQSAHGQVKIGIRFGGAVSSPRIKEVSDTIAISRTENVIRPMFGLTLDVPIKDNVAFTSGVNYTPKKVALSYTGTGTFQGTESYRLQYLQVPLLIRFRTNEISPGLKIYFTTGFAPEFKVFEESNERDPAIVQKFRPFDVSFNLGSGAEISIGPDTILYGGFVYYRGLINAVKDDLGSDAELKINNDMIGIEVGVRF